MNTQFQNKIYDTIVIGAGISGISAACHLKKYSPEANFLILEGRDNFGGTWDFFKYPGIRSDSDMHTLGFSFKPWNSRKFIADGPAIMGYLDETIEENNLKDLIKFNMHIESASWNSEDSVWELRINNKKLNKLETIKTKFIQMCAGYYSYKSGHKPIFKGSEDFVGQIIHPQEWNSSIDYENKKVAVIGSGATAVTLIPEIAKKASHVTMIQRSPTYIASAPSKYKILHLLNYISPKLGYKIIRFTNILRQRRIYRRAIRSPELVKNYLLDLVRDELPGFDIEKHFTPTYNPWEQRLCLAPDSDFFESINQKRVSVETETIDSFSEKGVQLDSGKLIEADIIVTATGIKLQNFGGIRIFVDENEIDISKSFIYKSMMYTQIPNFINTFGYINASWTLKADLTSKYACRLINFMNDNNYAKCLPIAPDDLEETKGFLDDFSSGYVRRAASITVKQGNKKPWINNQNYLKDIFEINYGKIEDNSLRFS